MTEPWPPLDEGWSTREPLESYAGFGTRLVGLLIDGLALSLVNRLLVGLTGGWGDSKNDAWGMGWSAFLISLAVGIGYTTFFLGSPSGQTLGMRVMQIRAMDAETGGRIDYGRCVTRYVVGVLSGLALGFGYLWMLWDPQRQTWHDKAAGTVVVRVEAHPVEKWPG